VDAVEVFTTRIDTIHGVSFLAISHENMEVMHKLKIASPAFASALQEYLQELDLKKQQGFSTVSVDVNNIDPGVRVPGLHAINPINGTTVPIYVTSYVRADYGPGAIMGVPAHDERDYAFAQKHRLPVLKVVDCETQTLISSGSASGLSIKDAQKQIL
jgi:leucyl-tRNA synthetase